MADNVAQQALDKARQVKASLLNNDSDNPKLLIKGSLVGALIGLGFGFMRKKNLFAYAAVGAMIGGVINGFVVPAVKENM